MSLLLTDNGILQRGVKLPLSGKTQPGSAVQISFAGNIWTTRADKHGTWRIEIGPLDTGSPDSLIISHCEGEDSFKNIVVGDVWICSGQSNMEMTLAGTEHGEQDAKNATIPGLRLLSIPKRVSDIPLAETGNATWRESDPQSAATFSALAFYTGRHLQQHTEIPIGLVLAAVGATPCEAWTPMDTLESDNSFAPILSRWHKSLQNFPDNQKIYDEAFVKWDHDADQAEREGRPIPGPHPKLIGPDSAWTPAGLFNGMIAPLVSTPIKGVLWYQGASQPDRAYQYRELFRAMIRSWRNIWRQGDFPFIYGQEANFGPKRNEPCEHSWAELREAQSMALAEPNSAMAVAIDTGEEKDIHPKKKEPLGHRMALAARKIAYGEDIPYSGPTFRSMTVDGDTARVQFDHVYGGLKTSDGAPLIGFAISGGCDDFTRGNRGFAWADATIDGNEVIVRAESVKNPVAVRYAWAQNPNCNLVNSEDLPAVPFRSDDWPGVTIDCR